MARHTGEREIASTAYVRTALAARGMPAPGTGSHSQEAPHMVRISAPTRPGGCWT